MMHRAVRAGIFVCLAFVVVVELLALTASAKVSSLECIHADPDGTWYINARTMVSPAGNKISFLSTVVPVKGGEYYTRTVTALQKARKNPLRLDHIRSPLEVNCSTRKVITSNILFYDKKDRIVHTVNVPPSVQQAELTGPEAYRLLSAVCGPKIAQLMGE